MVEIVKGKRFVLEIELEKLTPEHELHISDCLASYGREIKDELYKIITTGKRSGRVYRYRGSSFVASAPGQPPSNRSGRLASGSQYKARQRELLVYNDVEYAGFLEMGTVKMSPRPWFARTNEENSYKLERDLNDFHS